MAQLLVADGERAREGGNDRAVTDVAVGVLLLPDGAWKHVPRRQITHGGFF